MQLLLLLTKNAVTINITLVTDSGKLTIVLQSKMEWNYYFLKNQITF